MLVSAMTYNITIIKNMSPMLTMVGHCRQDSIIYKCTKLYDHSKNLKMRYPLRCACHIFGRSGERRIPLTFKKIIFFALMGTFI